MFTKHSPWLFAILIFFFILTIFSCGDDDDDGGGGDDAGNDDDDTSSDDDDDNDDDDNDTQCTGNPECDDGQFCNGAEQCNDSGHCEAGEPPCMDDDQFCNGSESCDEENDQCDTTGNPCPDDGLFCNGDETCDETEDSCGHAGNPCADDGIYCNGTESCDETEDSCDHSGNPCPDDGLYCNGDEVCDEANDGCLNSGDPCDDDNLFCNGTESCDETEDSCDHSGDPCDINHECDEDNDECDPITECENDEDCDDDLYCTGVETCVALMCASGTNPCTDDNTFCNGTEGCDEENDQCTHGGDPCIQDALYCNGTESCNEDDDRCDHSGNPCTDDSEFCNGAESCDEANDECDHSGDPCPQDILYCNGDESCNEDDDQCDSSGDPCDINHECSEANDACESILRLRGSNFYDDSIEAVIVGVQETDRDDYYIQGGWSFISGKELGEWYETFTITINEDIPMTYNAESEFYHFDIGSIYGDMWLGDEENAPRMILYIDGDYAGHTELWDAMYLARMPTECPMNHAPFMFYELFPRIDCVSGEILDYFEVDENHEVFIPTDECWGIMWALSEPDCNWEGGRLYMWWNESWYGLLDVFDADDLSFCSWFSSDGYIWGITYAPHETEESLDWYYKIHDGCDVPSLVVQCPLNFIAPEKKSAIKAKGDGIQLPEGKFYRRPTLHLDPNRAAVFNAVPDSCYE